MTIGTLLRYKKKQLIELLFAFLGIASVYILNSKELGRYYNRSCTDLAYRVDQHFNKDFNKSFTAKADDWKLYFYRYDLTYVQARSIEAHIKKMRNSLYIENLKKHHEIIEKLILKYSEWWRS